MKNKDKITLLKAKVIKLKQQLKDARLELADKDLPTYKVTIDEINGVDGIVFTDNPQQLFIKSVTPPNKQNIDYDFGG